MRTTPELRFPEFKTKWEKVQLSQKGEFTKGMGVSKGDLALQGVPAIRYGELYTTYHELITEISSKVRSDAGLRVSRGNEVLIPSSGETAIDIATASALLEEGVVLGGDINVFRTSESPHFIAASIRGVRKLDIAKLAQGISVSHVYGSDIKKVLFSFPTIPEQQKISAFLSTVDKKVASLKTQLIGWQEFKKRMTGDFFSQSLRFTADDGSCFPTWKRKRFGEMVKQIKQSVPSHTTLPVYSSSRTGLLPQDNYFDGIKLSNANDYGVVPTGAFVFRHMSDDSTFKFNINRLDTSIAVSKEYPVFTSTNSHPDFVLTLLNEGDEFKRFAHMQKAGGTRTRLYFSKLENFNPLVPSLPEQRKIANYLMAIDIKIEALTDRLQATREFKRGLLQKMFV